MTDSPPTPTQTARRGLLYTLALVFLGLVVCCAGLLGSFSVWRGRQQASQGKAAAAVEALGGEVSHVLSSFSPLALALEQGDAPNIFILSGKQVTDRDLKLLDSAPTTRGLYLSHNGITDQGLVHLSGLEQLETLDLKHNPGITDAGVKNLEGLTNLKQLILYGTQVTPAGVAKLQQKLPHTKIAR